MSAERVKPRTMAGVMELLPKEQVAFQALLDTIRRGYERFGFVPIETPVMELSEVLLTKSGGETEKQVYFVQSTGAMAQGRAAEMALRFDLTVPLARYVAEHEHQLVFPFRRYQIQRVYRGESAQRGRFREFYQCDIDVIGKDSLGLGYDAEIPAIIAGIFRELDCGPFTIRVNNRKILSGLLQDLGVSDPAQVSGVLREIDKLDKRGRPAVVATLGEAPFSLAPESIERLMATLELTGSNQEILGALESHAGAGELYSKGVKELRTVMERIALHGVPEKECRIDLGIARGLDYYTGTVYETSLDEHQSLGSVCSGGRYDELASHYTKSSLPGVGISIGATRLFDQLRAIGYRKAAAAPVEVVVARFDPALDGECLAIASELRKAGFRTESIVDDWKPKKQLQYVDRIGAPLVIILGAAEMQAGVVALKDARSGEQTQVPRDALVGVVRSKLSAPA